MPASSDDTNTQARESKPVAERKRKLCKNTTRTPNGGGSKPNLHNNLAYVPDGYKASDITFEVPYKEIHNQEVMPWFMDLVKDLQEQGAAYPQMSHGVHPILANIHRAKPRIVVAYEVDDTDQLELFPTISYESAGVWVDSLNELVLVIYAKWEDQTYEGRLLYASARKERKTQCTKMGEWCVVDAGKGGHLKVQPDATIKCDAPTREPPGFSVPSRGEAVQAQKRKVAGVAGGRLLSTGAAEEAPPGTSKRRQSMP